MEEGYISRLIAWTKLKARLHFAQSKIVYYKEREIWWVSLGTNIGYEQDGKHANFERPVIILKKFNRHLFLALPLTSKKKIGPYYYNYSFGGKEYSAILWQLRAVSSRRLLRKIRTMPEQEFRQVKERIKGLI